MKRDMDLIREILRTVEACEDSYGINSPAIEGYSEAQVAYHLKLLIDGGLIEAKDVDGEFQQDDEYIGINLTWDGQDFLNAARDNSLWKKAKEAVINSGVGFTVQSLLAWLKAQVLM
jgi:DNA-binding transcriptional ArsR family regulator